MDSRKRVVRSDGQKTDKSVAKKIIVSVVGFTVLLIGIVMIVTPGPALIVIPAGLTILASEYSWARRWLQKIKKFGSKTVEKRPERMWLRLKRMVKKSARIVS